MNLFGWDSSYRYDWWGRTELGRFIGLGVICLMGLLLLFFMDVHTIVCAGGICKGYTQQGTIGLNKKLEYQFRTADIESYTYLSHIHEIRRRRNVGYSRHTDYTAVLKLKDGRTIQIPIRFCHDKSDVDAFVQKIKSGKYFKKNNIRYF